MKNLLVATVLLAASSGCALLRSQVAVFHQLPKDLSGTTYAMIPFKEALRHFSAGSIAEIPGWRALVGTHTVR